MRTELSNTELAVLGLIAEAPGHGYHVEQMIDARGMREWTEVGFSSIYYLLNKMEECGWLDSDKVDGQERPARKIYRITPAGSQVLAEAVLLRLRSPHLRSGDFDLGLANLWVVSQEEALAAMEGFAEDLRQRYQHVRRKWASDGKEALPFAARAVFDHSLSLIRRELEWVESWCEKLKQEIQK